MIGLNVRFRQIHDKPLAKCEGTHLISGKIKKIKIELQTGHIRYWLNGKIILEVWDALPIKANPVQWIGVRTWNTNMEVKNIRIYQPQLSVGNLLGYKCLINNIIGGDNA